MVRRKGLGKGTGKGYKNIIGKDSSVHSQSAKGIKQPTFINESKLNAIDKHIINNNDEKLNILYKKLSKEISNNDEKKQKYYGEKIMKILDKIREEKRQENIEKNKEKIINAKIPNYDFQYKGGNAFGVGNPRNFESGLYSENDIKQYITKEQIKKLKKNKLINLNTKLLFKKLQYN